MKNKFAIIALLLLIPVCAVANQKERAITKLQVVTAKTRIHSSSSGDMFTYTNLVFAEVNGKKLVYECAAPGDVCPVMSAGETYTATQDGTFVYVPMSTPESKRDLTVKFKQVGNW